MRTSTDGFTFSFHLVMGVIGIPFAIAFLFWLIREVLRDWLNKCHWHIWRETNIAGIPGRKCKRCGVKQLNAGTGWIDR